MSNEIKITQYKNDSLIMLIAPLVYLAMSIFVMFSVMSSGNWPSGSDTYYYIYRSDIIYNSFKQGIWYPLIDMGWYNGLGLKNCVSQLTPYAMALCQALSGGSAFNGYILFVGAVLFLGALSFLAIGKMEKRPYLGAFLGLYWFFMPNNLLALFVEGALARSMIMTFMPLLFYVIYSYLIKPDYRKLIPVTFFFFLAALTHVGYAGMILIALVISLLVYGISTTRYSFCIEIFVFSVLGFILSGIWLVPYLTGESSGVDSSEAMSNFFQNIFLTLNPYDRISSGFVNFYFGLSIFIISIAGLLFSNKSEKASFITSNIILILSMNSMYFVLSRMPGGQYLWMLRFFSIAGCFVLVGMVFWKTLKKKFLFIFSVLLIIDVIPSLSLVYGEHNGIQPVTELNNLSESTLIGKGKEYTYQRMALMDLSTLSAKGAFLVSGYDEDEQRVMSTFGAGWESAVTASNISQINKAVKEGYYLYLFDRLLELGNDTVIIRLSQCETVYSSVQDIINCAGIRGYELKEKWGDYLLFHLNDFSVNNIPADNIKENSISRNAADITIFDDEFKVYDVTNENEVENNPENKDVSLKNKEKNLNNINEVKFGVITEYESIGIGTGAPQMSLQFPSLEETDSIFLDDYTYEDLCNYKVIFLNGFEYRDKKYAEDLILRLSEEGVHVVIAADGIPEDRKTHEQSFLGVRCNDIVFSNGYPELITIDGNLNTTLFPQGFTTWKTVYLEGLNDVWGRVVDNDIDLAFYGTGKNENIIYIGINLTYYYGLTKDINAGRLLTHAMVLDSQELPKRTLVPVEIQYDGKEIIVNSIYDNVNTTMAYHDVFESDSDIEHHNHLLYVNSGKTVINLNYSMFIPGLIVSLAGIVLTIIFLIHVRKKLRVMAE